MDPPRPDSALRQRGKRQLPGFMYGSTYPKQSPHAAGNPTYTGALEWLKDHASYIDTMVDILQKYPDLVKEPCMDRFWDYTQPLVYNNDLLVRYDQFLSHQFGFRDNFHLGESLPRELPTPAMFFKRDGETRSFEYTHPVHRVVACFPPNTILPGTKQTASPTTSYGISKVADSRKNENKSVMSVSSAVLTDSRFFSSPGPDPTAQLVAKDNTAVAMKAVQQQNHGVIKQLVIEALSPFVHVRTNAPPELSDTVQALDVCKSVCGGTLVFLVCDATLNDPVCRHLLCVAIAYSSPIVMVREPGYQLPNNIPDEVIQIVKEPQTSPFRPTSKGVRERKQKVKHDLEHEELGEIGPESPVATAEPTGVVHNTKSLKQVILEQFSLSIVFNLKLVSPSILDLYRAINKECPAPFPMSPSGILLQKRADTVPLASASPARFLSRLQNEGDMGGEEVLRSAMNGGRPKSAAAMSHDRAKIVRIGSARTTRPFSAAGGYGRVRTVTPFNAFAGGQAINAEF